MRRAVRTVLIAAGLAGSALAATAPAEARTFVSVGFGGPIGWGGYGYPAYRYPAYGYYPAYYAPPVVYGGGWYGRPYGWGGPRYWGRPGWGGYGYHRGWRGRYWR